ncbi:hypothetical protein [Fimbriiglobus ruber]|uniref:Lipoprotein n=1 Tax=Fimbriiglobus ruber TaxID=1908690 RepID=A0A225DQJ5_9BACT|nr:hypothetical protein [Fimbriiglobus ruber]OWK43662.1 hypothetical protein FRUB_03261 [Fimbriiglobus ruber]
MSAKFLRPGVAALGLFGAAAPAPADPPAAPPASAPAAPARPAEQAAPQIIRWPGGWMYLNGPDTIVRQTGTPGSKTVITGSANGVGNKIVVDNDGTPGVTILKDVRNGVGNSVTVTPAGPVVNLPPDRPQPPEHSGRGPSFWTKKAFSQTLGCNLYWSPKDKAWYRYDKADGKYRPVPDSLDPTVEAK